MKNLNLPYGSDAPPEQPKADASAGNKGDYVGMSTYDKKDPGKKSASKALILLVSLVGLLATAALLIGLLPDWGSKKASKNLDTDSSSDDETSLDGKNKTAYFESNAGPFEVKLPLFSADITKDYESIDEAKGDIEQIARFLLNGAILSNVASGQQNPIGGGEGDFVNSDGSGFAAPVAAPEAGAQQGGDVAKDESQSAPVSGNGATADLGGANDFGTNNQEDNVDRADLAKSDGKFLFVAYGDYVLVVTADGLEEIARIEVPPIVLPPGYEQDYPSGGSSASDSGVASPPSDGIEKEPMAVDSGFAAMPPFFWNPKPYIDALLIEGNRLAIVASGYSAEHTMPFQGSDQAQRETPIFWDYQNTKVHLYDINDGNAVHVTTKTLNGSFRDAFSMAGSGYVVTQAGVNTWDSLLAPIQRWQEKFARLDDDEYLAMATQIARDELIPTFVSRLVDGLQASGPVDLTRLSLYSDSVSDDGESEISLFADGIANAVTHVVSFNMLEAVAEGEELPVDIDATFQPGYWGHVYAHEQMIIIADQGWNWDEEEQISAQMTYLLGFRLDGPSSTHSVVGSVPGHILSPYSVDFVEVDGESFLRLATTQNFWSRWMIATPVDFVAVGGDMMVVEDAAQGGEMDATTTTVAEPEPVREPEPEPSESTTLNQIIVLKFPSEESSNVEENVLEIVGQEEMGKPNESFTTVRFFDNIAYAVTYERIDPFYVVDLSDPYDPEVLGSLDVPGFSEYLHPINSDNTILAAVGQLTDENSGRQLGMQISVFDARNPLGPTLLARLPITEDGNNSWSSSPVSWDPRAFRFLRLGDGVGRLIMPISTYTVPNAEVEAGEVKPEPEQFEGFVMFAIDVNADDEDQIIQRVLDIDHTDTMNFQDGFYYCSWLPERSFVVDGNLITMKAHSIVSTELTSSDRNWVLDVDKTDGGCPMYYYY